MAMFLRSIYGFKSANFPIKGPKMQDVFIWILPMGRCYALLEGLLNRSLNAILVKNLGAMDVLSQ